MQAFSFDSTWWSNVMHNKIKCSNTPFFQMSRVLPLAIKKQPSFSCHKELDDEGGWDAD